MTKPYILVVEDEVDQAINIQEILEGAFSDTHDCLVAHSGTQALALMREHASEVSLILLDINMPGMDGTELYDELEKFYFASMPPIVVLTAQVFVDQMIDVMTGRDFFDYLTKPYSVKILVDTCHRALTEKRLSLKGFSKDFLMRELIYQRNMYLMNWYSSVGNKTSVTYEAVFDQLVPTQKTSLSVKELSQFLTTLSNDTNESPIDRWSPKVGYLQNTADETRVISDILDGYSCEFQSFDDLTAIRTFLEVDQLDVLLLDVTLSGHAFQDVLGLVREVSNPSLEIVVISGIDDVDQVKVIMQDGVDKFIQKPFTGAKLIKEVMHSF